MVDGKVEIVLSPIGLATFGYLESQIMQYVHLFAVLWIMIIMYSSPKRLHDGSLILKMSVLDDDDDADLEAIGLNRRNL